MPPPDVDSHGSLLLFLGAGASSALGYPLTSEILPEILTRLAAGTLFTGRAVVQALPHEHKHPKVNSLGYREDAADLLRFELEKLFPTLFDTPTPPNITDILSLIDHFIISGSALPEFSRERLARLRGLLERALATVVIEPATRTPDQRQLVERLKNWLVRESAAARRITIVTTNYDLAVERPLVDKLKASGREIDYGFTWRDPLEQEGAQDVLRHRPLQPAIAFYKLHGSINWVRCAQCDHVYINESEGPIFQLCYSSRARDITTCACGHFPFGTLLVAPSMIRDVREPSLLSIWQAALEAMRLAERWVMIGYSLPPEDLAIRSMLLRASRGRETAPRVEVFDVGNRPDIVARYRLLLTNVDYDGGGLERFVDRVAPK